MRASCIGSAESVISASIMPEARKTRADEAVHQQILARHEIDTTLDLSHARGDLQTPNKLSSVIQATLGWFVARETAWMRAVKHD